MASGWNLWVWLECIGVVRMYTVLVETFSQAVEVAINCNSVLNVMCSFSFVCLCVCVL